MILWLAIVAFVGVLSNVCVASTAITETAAWHVDGPESTPPSAAEQARPASALVFLVRPPRSNPPRRHEPATKNPSEVLPTCKPLLRAPKNERARASHHGLLTDAVEAAAGNRIDVVPLPRPTREK